MGLINSQSFNDNKKRELLLLKEENRRLKDKLDDLSLEILRLKGLGYNVSTPASQHMETKMKQQPKLRSSAGYGTFPPAFPITLQPNAKFITKLLFPTKKLAYHYAVYGIKHTLKKSLQYIKKKIKSN